jgi:hypothetical protein
VVLLPVAIGIAIVALLANLRRERHARETGRAVPRPVFVTLTLAVLAVVGLLYVGVYVMSILTMNGSSVAN